MNSPRFVFSFGFGMMHYRKSALHNCSSCLLTSLSALRGTDLWEILTAFTNDEHLAALDDLAVYDEENHTGKSQDTQSGCHPSARYQQGSISVKASWKARSFKTTTGVSLIRSFSLAMSSRSRLLK